MEVVVWVNELSTAGFGGKTLFNVKIYTLVMDGDGRASQKLPIIIIIMTARRCNIITLLRWPDPY